MVDEEVGAVVVSVTPWILLLLFCLIPSASRVPIPSSRLPTRSCSMLIGTSSALIVNGSLAAVDAVEVEDRAGDEVLEGGEVERREDAHEDGEESASGDDKDAEEHEEPWRRTLFSLFLVARCFLPVACLSPRRRCLSG